MKALFASLSGSDRRLKGIPGIPLPSTAIPFEFAAIQALRSLELTDAARLLIGRGNRVAAFPVLRALFETWIAVEFAIVRFTSLVLEGNHWDRFDQTGMRLLRGRSDAADPLEKVIKIGDMISTVKAELGELDAAFLTRIYDDLSDWTHPTIWSATLHMQSREDGLGTILNRHAEQGDVGPLWDLDMLLAQVSPQRSGSLGWLTRFGSRSGRDLDLMGTPGRRQRHCSEQCWRTRPSCRSRKW